MQVADNTKEKLVLELTNFNLKNFFWLRKRNHVRLKNLVIYKL